MKSKNDQLHLKIGLLLFIINKVSKKLRNWFKDQEVVEKKQLEIRNHLIFGLILSSQKLQGLK